jgi:AraC-like DNA-binding protein
MRLIRWSASNRILPSSEVDEGFVTHGDETLLFAFTTDSMDVGRHTGPFSFKLVTHGAERYRIGRRTVLLTPGQVLLTNAGQEYQSRIDVRRTRAISCFLPPSRVQSTIATIRDRAADRLDDPAGRTRSCNVFQVPLRPQPELSRILSCLDAAVRAPAPPLDALEELVLEAAGLAICGALAIVPPEASLGAARHSTREELVARVVRARDFIQDRAGRVTLGQMADVASLSPWHFLRVFKAAFGATPASYARRIRLARGQALVAQGASATRAGRAAGFASGSTFLRSLRATTADATPALGARS